MRTQSRVEAECPQNHRAARQLAKLLTGLDWVSANLIKHYLNIILCYLKGQFTQKSISLIFLLNCSAIYPFRLFWSRSCRVLEISSVDVSVPSLGYNGTGWVRKLRLKCNLLHVTGYHRLKVISLQKLCSV